VTGIERPAVGAAAAGLPRGVVAPRVVVSTGESFESFYRRELPSLVSLGRALSRTPSLGDDLAQEAMLAAYRRWDEIGGYDNPAAWVRRVCANMSLSHLRRLGAESRALLRLGAIRQPTSSLPASSEAVWAAVRRLPRRQAQSIALCYVCDLSIADIAATLGCSEGAVKVHLSRARKTLAQKLGADGEDLS
jgi:RNA polymerase sigma-70 factor (ECF subfamily)